MYILTREIVLTWYLHITSRTSFLPLCSLRLLQPFPLLLLLPLDILRGNNPSVGPLAVLLGHEYLIVAVLAEQLVLVLVESAGVQSLPALEAFNALLVEGTPVSRHNSLCWIYRYIAGRTPGGGGGTTPRHDCWPHLAPPADRSTLARAGESCQYFGPLPRHPCLRSLCSSQNVLLAVTDGD